MSHIENEVTYEAAKKFILDSPVKQDLIISGGEPTIHKDFLKIVRFAKQNFEHVSLMTNGIKFADMDFLKSTIDAGVDRISIPFYSSNESELNHMVGNPNAYSSVMKCLSNINKLLPLKPFDVHIKLLLAKFTYKINPSSIDFIASRFGNLKNISLFGFHISDKALRHAKECIINYNESRSYNDLSIEKLQKHGFDYHVCEVPLCAFSERTIGILLKSKRIVYTGDTYLKRPDSQTKVVSSSILLPKNCMGCALLDLCPKILKKNASSFDHGIKPLIF